MEKAMNNTSSGKILKQSKSNFALAFLGLPKDQRLALESVYAYCRIVDDIADESKTLKVAQQGLNQWRKALNQWPQFSEIQTEAAQNLSSSVQRFPILQSDLIWILNGVEKDLTNTRYNSLDDLLDYCDSVATAVGFCCMSIFGVERAQASEYVFATGRALQLTNILRDVASDARRGRIYIPQNLLSEFDLTDDDLLTSRYDDAFLKMIQAFSETVQSYYDLSQQQAATLPMSKIWPAEVMRKTYFSIFQKIRERSYKIFDEKITISKMRKAWIALSQPRA